MSWRDFLLRHQSEILARTVEHIGLVAAAMGIALAIGRASCRERVSECV